MSTSSTDAKVSDSPRGPQNPGAPDVVVAGEALVDIVVPPGGDPHEAPGGSPMNVAVGLSRLGLRTLLMTDLGDDDRGSRVREHLHGSGVTLDDRSVVAGSSTSTATAHLDLAGAATYDFDLHWVLGPRSFPAGARALHVGSLGTSLRPGRAHVVDLVDQAFHAEALVTFDPNARPRLAPDAGQAWRDAAEVAALAHLVKLSDEDLEFLRPGITAPRIAEELLAGTTDLVVVTAGGRGATAFSAVGTVEVRSRDGAVVDTVGAGDSFMAALVAIALEHGLDDLAVERMRGYLEAAHEVAAVTVSRRGADPPTRAELAPGWPGVR